MATLYPELNISWLLIGEELGGPMLKETKKEKPTPQTREEHTLPLIPFEAVAGPGDPIYEDERIEDYYTVSDFKESDFLIRVKGDSMVPKYNGGDIVACKKVDMDRLYFLQWGRVYVIYTRSQGAMIKRVQPSEKEDRIKCVSENIKYAPFEVPVDDIVSVALVNGSISLD
jgi:phage repressor protein C with HTH and peptisase S24 domain